MSFLQRLFGGSRSPAASGEVARDRLKLVLEYDRAKLTPAQLDQIRDDIIEAISRHVTLGNGQVEVKLEAGGRLVAEIPLGRAASDKQ